MRYIIAAATALTLIVGIAIGFALTATVFEAEAKPPPEVQPVEEQNVDGSGFIAVHEQGVADVNVVSMPSQDPGPLEFTHVIAKLCVSESALCIEGTGAVPNVNEQLTSLSAQGWKLVEVTSASFGPADKVIFTLSRPVP